MSLGVKSFIGLAPDAVKIFCPLSFKFTFFKFLGEPKCEAYYDDYWIFGEGSGEGESNPKDDQLIVDQGSEPSEQGSGSGEGSGDGGKIC